MGDKDKKQNTVLRGKAQYDKPKELSVIHGEPTVFIISIRILRFCTTIFAIYFALIVNN